MRPHIFSAAIVLSLIGSSLVSPCVAGDPLKIFILAGQSNMAGNGVPAELPAEYQKHPDHVLMPIPPRYRKGRSRTDLVPFAPFPERFGPEVGFAHAMAKAWPDSKIVLIKKAIGGTSALAWAPDWTRERAAITENDRVGPLYQNLMTNQIKPILQRYGDDAEIVGILWAQGGRDGRYEKAAADYEQNLTRIIKAFRSDLKKPDLPFVLAHTVDAPERSFPHIERVRAAQKRIAESLPHTALVPIEGLSRKRDRVHFDTAGQLELGRRFAATYLKLVGKTTAQSSREETKK
jgi:hypothetical protein